MYRSRLGEGLGEGVLGYVSSMSEDAALLHHDILGSRAHTVMLCRTGLVSKRDAARILAALAEVEKEGPGEPGGAEDLHELVEALVIKKAGRASGGRMHTARSRNDQVATDMRLKIRGDVLRICAALLDCAEALASVAARHARTIMPLYTHMQQAQAGTFSHFLLAHADALLRDYQRFLQYYARANMCPLGAGPAGGTSLAIDRAMTARLLGFDGVVENSLDAAGSRDFAAEFASLCAMLLANLSRLAEDFVVWSTSEFGFVELADGFASPSSVMPQKKNPDILELTRGRAASAIGSAAAVLAMSKGLASGYGRDLQAAKPHLWSCSESCAGALSAVRGMILTVTVDKARMRWAADSGQLTALDVAEALVAGGTPFRDAHAASGRMSKRAAEKRVPLSRLGPADARACAKGLGIKPADLLKAARSATVPASLKSRVSQGSAGFDEQERMASDRLLQVSSLRPGLDELCSRVEARLAELDAQVKKIRGR